MIVHDAVICADISVVPSIRFLGFVLGCMRVFVGLVRVSRLQGLALTG